MTKNKITAEEYNQYARLDPMQFTCMEKIIVFLVWLFFGRKEKK